MQHVLSTHLFVNHRLTTVWLDRVWDGGFPEVEIFCARQHLDYRDRAQIRELGHWFRDCELRVHSLHSPMFSDDVWGRSGPQAIVAITELDKGKRIRAIDEIKRALEIAETVPFRYLIQHLGVTGEEFDEARVDAAFSALEEIKMFAQQRGVEVLLENTPNELASASRLLTFFEMTHMDLNVCFDVGHAHMRGNIPGEYRLLKQRIRSTHIHDNDGTHDAHWFPLGSDGGTIDWPEAMELLRSGGDRYPLMLELREVEDIERPIQMAKSVLQRLEELPAPERDPAMEREG
jgi:sugar phosphate isomerase/epimerase